MATKWWNSLSNFGFIKVNLVNWYVYLRFILNIRYHSCFSHFISTTYSLFPSFLRKSLLSGNFICSIEVQEYHSNSQENRMCDCLIYIISWRVNRYQFKYWFVLLKQKSNTAISFNETHVFTTKGFWIL